MRYDTEEELKVLNELYGYLRLYTNFFQPSTKLMRQPKNISLRFLREATGTALLPYYHVGSGNIIGFYGGLSWQYIDKFCQL
jgi:hypothetical protein